VALTSRQGIRVPALLRVSALLGAAAALTACGASAQKGVSVQVAPRAELFDQPFRVTVGGLHPDQAVTIALRSTDANSVAWASTATFHADSRGSLDIAHADQSLLWPMQPASKPGDPYYIWSKRPSRFTVTARVSGQSVASASFTRRVAPPGLTGRKVTLAQAGFAGELVLPAHRARRGAVVVIGGSDGGLPAFQAIALAAVGYPALAVAYFKYPGLPKALAHIPLEYFARALTWLSRQPGIDPNRLVMLGVSRGSEAALLMGVHYPRLVHAVIGMVPSDVAYCSFPGCLGPAWTFRGRPVPYLNRAENPAANPAAVIPVERIRGPVMVACGEYDQTWDSCEYSRAIMARLNAHHDRYVHVRYAYPGAGHYVGLFVTDQPASVATDPSAAADEQARALLWPRLLAFLAKVT
jgi:dienelactone hydrolase